MRSRERYCQRGVHLLLGVVVWVILIAAGFGVLYCYSSTPGAAAPAPERWPAGTALLQSTRGSTLLMFIHPKCPCSRASLHELERAIAQAEGDVSAQILFVRPEGVGAGWEKSDLWNLAAMIPGVERLVDDGGVEARRFGAMTSGFTVIYDVGGRLVFAGGMTSSRGHEGDNAGRDAVVQCLRRETPVNKMTPVFGCPLHNDHSACSPESK